ncbi:MAG: ABC transporter permease [Deltaproteobacteria bacterium]|nr:MAG: ABC transporter permease [Deltaproteobacteria bacterium]TMQ17604.1 MAG: ABC transporter permease [Deltaproteobacteria bacterium]
MTVRVPGRGPGLSPSAWIGLVMLAVYAASGLAGPLIAPYDLSLPHVELAHQFEGSSPAHWLGTDPSGHDTLSQLLWGARSALELSVIVVAISSAIGLVIGTIAGWFGGAVDEIVMRTVDVLMAFPGILLNIAIVATVAHPGVPLTIAALCANGWVGYARVARGQVLALRDRDYVTAAVALGASHRRVMTRHLIPNLMGPAMVQMSFGLGSVIIIEASLSFLGIGPQLDYTWGAMLDQARNFLWNTEWVRIYALVPGLAITWVVLGANLLGDGLRDRLDPRQRGRGA